MGSEKEKIKEDKEKLDWLNLEKRRGFNFVDKDYVEYEVSFRVVQEKCGRIYRIDSIRLDPQKPFMLSK